MMAFTRETLSVKDVKEFVRLHRGYRKWSERGSEKDKNRGKDAHYVQAPKGRGSFVSSASFAIICKATCL